MGVAIGREDVGPPVADDEGWAVEAVTLISGFDLYVTRDGKSYFWETFKTKEQAEAEATRLSGFGVFEVRAT